MPATAEAISPPATSTLEIEIEGAIASVALNRPEKANSMNAPMWAELQSVFTFCDTTDAIRAVILRGQGKHFCAGIDLEMLTELKADSEPARGAERFRREILRLQGNLSAIADCRKPVIAAIQGACVGGGLDIASCADLRYATNDARFSIKEIDVGLVADVGSLQRLPRLIGDGLLRELAFTGRMMGADEAFAAGLVSGVLESQEQLASRVGEIAQTIAAKSPLAIRGIKQTLAYGRDHGLADSLDYVATWNSAMLSFDDVHAAIAAAKQGAIARFDD
jgi:enoyl-CoA hydratase